MPVQQNRYVIVDNVVELQCVQRDGSIISALFPREYYELVARYHWYMRGKYGIYNTTAGSLASFLAYHYCYLDNKWQRIEPNEDYFPRNFTKKVIKNAQTTGNIANIRRKPAEEYESQKFPRVRWTNKYKCEQLELRVLHYGFPSKLKVKILINTYLRTYIPMYCVFSNSKLYTPTGIELAKLVLSAAMGMPIEEIPSIRAECNRNNQLDYRIDPNDNQFIAINKSIIRRHIVEEGVLLELRQRDDITNNPWVATASDASRHFRLPQEATRYKDRVSYLLVDTEVADKIDNVWYDSMKNEFIVSDIIVKDSRPIKFLVCDVFSIKYKNIYFQPRMKRRYAEAVKHAGDKGKYDRIIARTENNVNKSGYTLPIYQTRRRMGFNVIGFNTTIYGGVGIHYLDCRASALNIKSVINPANDRTKIIHHEQLKGTLE